MPRLGLGLGRRRPLLPGIVPPGVPPAPVVPSAPAGFVANGAPNSALRAMLARVRAGTGRGRIVFKGDSTTAGEGAGDVAGDALGIANARPYRPSAALAAALSAIGYRALDNATVGDNGANFGGRSSLSDYDPRVTLDWGVVGGKPFAGGNFLAPNTGQFVFVPTTPTDTLEFVLLNSGATSYTFLVDGAVPAAVVAPAAGSLGVVGNTVNCSPGAGFSRVVVKAASVGPHRWRIVAGDSAGAVRGVSAWDATVSAIDIINHASRGATAQEQAAGGNWYNNDALAFDAPDLTIVNVGLNNIPPQDPVPNYAAALRTIVATAKVSGDVLLVFPHPGGAPFDNHATDYRDVAAAVAAQYGVAFLSLFDYFGGRFTGELAGRMRDGLVHGGPGFYAEVADVYRRCIQVMAA